MVYLRKSEKCLEREAATLAKVNETIEIGKSFASSSCFPSDQVCRWSYASAKDRPNVTGVLKSLSILPPY